MRRIEGGGEGMPGVVVQRPDCRRTVDQGEVFIGWA